MSKKLVIVGGVAGGATAAARARRLSEDAEIIIFERGPDVAFANCGLPYHIGGQIAERRKLLVQTQAGLAARFNLDIRVRSEVIAIDRAARKLRVRDLARGHEYEETYDVLLLAPGAIPLRPPLPGINHPRVFTLRNMVDMDRIKQTVDGGAKSAVIVGGGFIGLELAENLTRRGLSVTLVELLPQVLPTFDPELAAGVQQALARHGVRLMLQTQATGFDDAAGRVRLRLSSGAELEADLVVVAVGVRPDTQLARDAGLELDERGALVVDQHMRTSDPCIYAVGDAVQVQDAVLGGPTLVPLAGPANRQARIAADNIFGRQSKFRGVQGTAIVRVFDTTAAQTGASEKVLRRRGVPYRRVYVHRGHHADYYPGAERMTIKLLFAPDGGRVLGAQIVGGAGVDKRIDVLALAIQAGMTVYDLEEAELAYAPQFGAAKDPINIVGFVAANLLRGDEEFVYAEELPDASRDQYVILDVRSPAEYEAGCVPGAKLLPLSELRRRWQELPRDRQIVTYCQVGQRAYYANRFLRQKGLRPLNLAGGLTTYRLVHAMPPAASGTYARDSMGTSVAAR